MTAPSYVKRADMVAAMRSNYNAEITEQLGRDWRRLNTVVVDQGNSIVEGEGLDFHMIELCRSGKHYVETETEMEGGTHHSGHLLPGGVAYVQRAAAMHQVCDGQASLQQIYIDDSIFRETAASVLPGDPDKVRFLGFQGTFDPGIRTLGEALLLEARSPQMGSALQAELIAQQIAVLILRRQDRTFKPTKSRRLSSDELARVVTYMEEDLSAGAGLDHLAGLLDMDVFGFTRAFKASTGQTPHRFLIERRLSRVKELLIHSTRSLAEIAYDTGFSSQPHMTAAFSKHVDMPPGAFRKVYRS